MSDEQENVIPTTSLSAADERFPSPTVSEEDRRCEEKLAALDVEEIAPLELEQDVIPETDPDQESDDEPEILDIDDFDDGDAPNRDIPSIPSLQDITDNNML